MRYFIFALSFCACSSALALPNPSDFREVSTIPGPAPASSGVVGCALPDGRYLLWNGDEVFLQQSVGAGVFTSVAQGYIGDPSFATLSFDSDFVLLGAGYGDGVNANVYPFDFNNPQDFTGGSEISTPSHFAAAFLTSSLVAFDVGSFGSPAEIIVIDLFPTMRAPQPPVTVLRRPDAPPSRDTIITKPLGSFSASIAVYGGTLYVADSGNGQYKSFPVADVVNAFNTSGTVAWSAGTDIGAPFDYPLGGVSGVTAAGNLVIAGFGSIVEVEPVSGNILTSFDPAGSGPFYGMIYNAVTEDFIAVAFPPTFGDPLTFYATTQGVSSLPAVGTAGLGALAAALGLLSLTMLRRCDQGGATA